jgi:hypothetical protein
MLSSDLNDRGSILGNGTYISRRHSVYTGSGVNPTSYPIGSLPGALSPAVKQTERKANHSPPFCAEFKEVCRYLNSPPRVAPKSS